MSEYDARTDKVLSAIRSLQFRVTPNEAFEVEEYLNDGTTVEACNNDSLIVKFEDGEKRYYRVFAEVTAIEMTMQEFLMTPEQLREQARANKEARTQLIRQLLAEHKQQKGI